MTNLNVKMAGNKGGRMYGDHMAVDPNNSNIVYYGSRKEGLQVSTDGGINFTQVSTSKVPLGIKAQGIEIGVNAIAFDPAGGTTGGKTKRIYAASWGNGLYYSSDAGNNWSQVISFANGGATDLEISQGVAFISVYSEGVKKYSPSNGVTTISPQGNNYIEDIAVDVNNNSIIYAVNNGFKDFYKTTNGGASWDKTNTNTRTTAGQENFQSDNIKWVENSSVRTWLSIGEIKLDPHNSSRMWFSEGMGMWRSTNISNTNNNPVFNNVSEGVEEMVASDVISNGTNVVFITWDRNGFVKNVNDMDSYATEQIGLTTQFGTGTSVALAPGDNNFFAAVSSNHLNPETSNVSGFSHDGGNTWDQFGSISGGGNNPIRLEFGELDISASNINNMVWD